MFRVLNLNVFKPVDDSPHHVVQISEEPSHIVAAKDAFLITTTTDSLKADVVDLSGTVKVLKSAGDFSQIGTFNLKNKDVSEIVYCPLDDSILTIEHESTTSAIKVVRHYTNWRAVASNSVGQDQLIAFELQDSRSIRCISIDASLLYASEKYLALKNWYQIVTATDGEISVYKIAINEEGRRELRQDPAQASSSGHQSEHFDWIWTINADARRVSICEEYLSYVTKNEVFCILFKTERKKIVERAHSIVCNKTIKNAQKRTLTTFHNSVILEHCDLKKIKKYHRRSNSSLSRSSSSSLLSSTTPGGTATPSNHPTPLHKGSYASEDITRRMSVDDAFRKNVAMTRNQFFQMVDGFDLMENSPHHYELLFDKQGVKNQVPYAELKVGFTKALMVPETASALSPPSSTSQPTPQVIVPIRDVHAYQVNTDEEYSLASCQLLFYKNLSKAAKNSNGQQDIPEDPDSFIHTLSILPIFSAPSPSDLLRGNLPKIEQKLVGIKLFASTPQRGMLWLFQQSLLVERTIYTYYTPTHKVVVTDTFLFALASYEMGIYLMRDLDSFTLSPESISTSSSSSDSSSTSTYSNVLVRRETQPVWFGGAAVSVGLREVACSNDATLILSVSTEEQLLKLRDKSLGQRGRVSSVEAQSKLEKGWNVSIRTFNTPNALLEQFTGWTSMEHVAASDLQVLIEAWHFVSTVITRKKQRNNSISDELLHNAITLLKRTFGHIAAIEYSMNNILTAAKFWALSNVSAEEAIGKLIQKGSVTSIAQEACVKYLQFVLLGPSNRPDLLIGKSGPIEDLVYSILSVDHAALLGQVVLESPLNEFNLENTIVVLEKTMADLEVLTAAIRQSPSYDPYKDYVVPEGGATQLEMFFKYRTMEEAQYCMTALALVVLMLRRKVDGKKSGTNLTKLSIRRSPSFLGEVAMKEPEDYLLKLQDHFLVPYLSTYSSLMFSTSDSSQPSHATEASTSSSSFSSFSPTNSGQKALLPSDLALLLVQTMPFTCIEIITVAGPEVFPIQYVHRLLNSKQAQSDRTLLFASYLESLVMREFIPRQDLNSSVTGSMGMLHSSSFTSQSQQINPSNGVDLQKQAPVLIRPHLISVIWTLCDIYICKIEMPSHEVAQMLHYTVSHTTIAENAHRTDPAVSLEGIWKEFHREFLIDQRHRYLEKVPPFIPTPKGPKDDPIAQFFYLFKLQGLLSLLSDQYYTKALNIQPIIQFVLKRISEENLSPDLTDSIQLLCGPFIGSIKDTIVTLATKYTTKCITGFLKKHLKLTDMPMWKATLDVLLDHAINKSSGESNSQRPPHLEDVLKFMARRLPTRDFLDLLPANGNVSFFIPFIELSMSRNAAQKLLREIQSLK